jgi:hypothetical protein
MQGMKKTLLLSTLLLTATTSNADSWYAGLSAGQSFANNRGDLALTTAAGQVYPGKKNLSEKQFFSGSLFVGQSIPVSTAGNLLLELGYAYNTEKSTAANETVIGDPKVTFQRPVTFFLNAGFEKPFANNVSATFKLGVLLSRFDSKLEDTDTNYSGQDNHLKWGFAPTLGIQKDFSKVTVGLNYSYQMYQNFTAKSADLATRSIYSHKISPRYHVVELSIVKKF